MAERYEGVAAAEATVRLYLPGEVFGYDVLGDDEYGLAVGGPNATALVAVGSPEEIERLRRTLNRVVDSLAQAGVTSTPDRLTGPPIGPALHPDRVLRAAHTRTSRAAGRPADDC